MTGLVTAQMVHVLNRQLRVKVFHSVGGGTPSTTTVDTLDILVLLQTLFGYTAYASRAEVGFFGLDASRTA